MVPSYFLKMERPIIAKMMEPYELENVRYRVIFSKHCTNTVCSYCTFDYPRITTGKHCVQVLVVVSVYGDAVAIPYKHYAPMTLVTHY